jgi:hypothetical protein
VRKQRANTPAVSTKKPKDENDPKTLPTQRPKQKDGVPDAHRNNSDSDIGNFLICGEIKVDERG